jgi:F-type H+-transporting ATPase subunit gamma
MTERLADIRARIDGIGQLAAVVNAMTGIAAARAHAARDQIVAVDSYAATIADAMGWALSAAAPEPSPSNQPAKLALLVFVAEQGFVGAFSERVLEMIAGEGDTAALFLVGSRGKAIASAQGLVPVWSAAMPSHSPGIPRLADRTMQAIFSRMGSDRIDRLDAVYPDWITGSVHVKRHRLFPLDLSSLPGSASRAPLMQLPLPSLLTSLGGDYLHAQICNVALHAFAAENEARMAAMSAARRQIENELAEFQAIERRVRQETITAEIIELAAGDLASRQAIPST